MGSDVSSVVLLQSTEGVKCTGLMFFPLLLANVFPSTLCSIREWAVGRLPSQTFVVPLVCMPSAPWQDSQALG